MESPQMNQLLPTTNNVVQPLLTDKYQVSMCYAYWLDHKHEDDVVFDLYFRKNPFKGEYTIFAGLDECIRYLNNFQFKDDDIEFLRKIPNYSHIGDQFWLYMRGLNGKSTKVYALREGSVCFPNLPLMRLEGPLGFLQLIETTMLNLINYASLVATNAARYRLAANPPGAPAACKLLEFGLRRAQGPDGGLSASRYAYIGGFDATSNLLAGKQFGIPVSGTQSHSFVMSYHGTAELQRLSAGQAPDSSQPGPNPSHKSLRNRVTNEEENFTLCCLKTEQEFNDKCKAIGHLTALQCIKGNDRSELKSFISFAVAFPESFLVLVDTYDVIRSGLINFCIVAIALFRFGYKPLGIRIDSGDLAYLSKYARDMFTAVGTCFGFNDCFKQLEIVASNDINEQTIKSLHDQSHAITSMGIGTHLVTCQTQPALGCVYKLVETNGTPCMKLSSVPDKSTIPCKKSAYRLFGRDGTALLDLIQLHNEPPPAAGQRVLCRHPFVAEKRSYATPTRVEPLLALSWAGSGLARGASNQLGIEQTRRHCIESVDYLTADIKRLLNPTPYKVSVTERLFNLLNELKLSLTPIGELA